MSVILKSGASANTANISAAGALQVDGSAVTQPVSISGSLSANITNTSLPVTAAATLPVSIAATLNVAVQGTVPISASSNLPVAVQGTVPVSIAATVPVSIAGTVTVVNANNSSTANAPSAQNVGTSSASILAANASRKECMVVNTGVNAIYLGLGQTPTATAYHVALSPCLTANDGTGGTYISDLWTGAINAIGAAAGTVVVTEMT